MKKILLALLLISLVFSSQVLAADSLMTPQAWYGNPVKDNMIVIKVTLLAASDGTFTPYQIVDTISTEKYWQGKYKIVHAWVVNSATDDHTNAATVTITDETTQQLIGATAGDTLTLSTAASGVAYLLIDRGSGQRAVTSKLTITIGDTGSTATLQTLYLVLAR
jgi:hypothetical protein